MAVKQRELHGTALIDHAGTKNVADKQADPGKPHEALEPFAKALLDAAKKESEGEANVSRAFALGWQMAELYTPSTAGPRGQGDRLPGMSALGVDDRRKMLISQITSDIAQLGDVIRKAGLQTPMLGTLSGKPSKGAIRAVHIALLTTLTATDYRFGKAYGLGRAMADTCRNARSADALPELLEQHRIANLLGWLDELSTALPPHAADSVARSIERWRDYVAKPPSPLDQDSVRLLRRQGELWRALLSGEKRGTEMLDAENYLDAVQGLAFKTRDVITGVLWRFPLMTLAVIGLVALGIYLLTIDSSGSIVAGATSLLAGVGLSWKALGGAAGRLVAAVEQPLWTAQLDVAIAEAVTLLPGNKKDHRNRRNIALAIRRPDLDTAPVHDPDGPASGG